MDPDATTPSYAAFVDRIHAEDRTAFEDMLEKAVRDGSNFEWDFRIVTPDGVTKYLHSLGHLSAHAQNTEFIGTVMDVSERRISEEALRGASADLERASRLSTMGQLTASIAHEINQPLAAIITNADACLLWLEADRPDLEEARQAATRVIRNGHRAGEIIKSVRALTRKSAPEMVSLDINDVIREVIVLMGGEFRRRGVRVETLLSSDLGSVIGDQVQLQQVVLNLIMNGIEAMADSAHGQRRIQIRSGNDESGGVLVAVTDWGSGSTSRGGTGSSRPSSPPSQREWGWGCRSAVRSLMPMAADCGRPNLPNGAVFQFILPAAGATQARHDDDTSRNAAPLSQRP